MLYIPRKNIREERTGESRPLLPPGTTATQLSLAATDTMWYCYIPHGWVECGNTFRARTAYTPSYTYVVSTFVSGNVVKRNTTLWL